MVPIYDAVGTLREKGVDVLSPSDPRVVDHLGEFLFVASDKLRSIKLVQNRHFEAIRNSDFLWVCCPDGYTGSSTAAEIGFAYASGIPVFSDFAPSDVTLQHYVRRMKSLSEAIMLTQSRARSLNRIAHVLLDPGSAIDGSIQSLEALRPILEGSNRYAAEDAEREYERTARALFGNTSR
jgi:nucleoside 2-deoxyribosyltransferase